MKLYLKCNSIRQLRATDALLPASNSEVKVQVRQLDDNPCRLDYQTNLDTNDILYEQRETLFYSAESLQRLVKGIYLGSDTCEHLLSYPRHLVEAWQFCQSRKIRLVVVFPPVAANSIKHAINILELINDWGVEAVVNDFGLLNSARRYPSLKIILGRLFNRVQRNAFADFLLPDEPSPAQWVNQQAVRGELEFAIPEVRMRYKALNVGRFTVDSGKYDFSFLTTTPRMNVDIYYPYFYLSSARACDTASAFDDRRAYFPFAECPRYCENHAVTLEGADNFKMIHRNNAFYRIEKKLSLPEEVVKNSRNRLVYEPML